MKLLQHIDSNSTTNMLLYGAIMFANIDYVSILDYLIKAILGGSVWFGFKLLQEYYSVRVRNKARDYEKPQQHQQDKSHE